MKWVKPEKIGEGIYRDWCKQEDIICEKVRFGEAGYPDRISILPNGIHVWVEFKRDGKIPEPLQYYRLGDLRKHGALAGWTDEYAVAICCLKALLATALIPEESYTPSPLSSRWRAVLRPWAGEDLNLLSVAKNFEIQRVCREDPNYRPLAAYVQGLAG